MPTIHTRASLDPDGAVTTEQRVRLSRSAVAWSDEGVRELADTYWREVAHVTRGLVRARKRGHGVELRLLGGPSLLRFGPPRLHVGPDFVSCSYPIAGGLLARVRGGSLTLAQSGADEPEVRTTVSGFHPSLAARPGFPAWTGALYARGQARIHDAVGRRFLAGLTGERDAMKVAVLGATGTIGSALVPVLAREHEVVAIARHLPERTAGRHRVARGRRDRRAEPARRARRTWTSSTTSSTRWARRTSRSATVAPRTRSPLLPPPCGAEQIVYLGGLGDDAPDLSPHLRSRAETAVRLAAGPVPVTTLGAAMIIGRGSAAFETIRALVDRLPGMICPRWVGVETQPVALDDVVRYLAGVAGRPEAYGRTYDVGGPEVMTYRTMIERIARLRGKHPLIVEVPVLTPRLSSLWLHLVTPVNASVARPLVEGLRTRTVARETRIRELVPFEPTPFDDAARAALEPA